jgi:tRNA (cytidine32/uridine32-2'-O)-methyltransferase
MLKRIKIILVEPYHPGNIGSTARAMKTMGLCQLILVKPRIFPSNEACALAAGAQDVLEQAEVYPNLTEAIADSTIVIGTSARNRSLPWPQQDVRTLAQNVIQYAEHNDIAIVFGPETMGLNNEQLQQCHYHLYIPGNPEYSVLNLAQAVQITCHELRMAQRSVNASSGFKATTPKATYPRTEDLRYFFVHLESTLNRVGFLIKQHPGKAMLRLKRLFTRVHMEKTELNMMRGILSRIDERLGEAPQCEKISPERLTNKMSPADPEAQIDTLTGHQGQHDDF